MVGDVAARLRAATFISTHPSLTLRGTRLPARAESSSVEDQHTRACACAVTRRCCEYLRAYLGQQPGFAGLRVRQGRRCARARHACRALARRRTSALDAARRRGSLQLSLVRLNWRRVRLARWMNLVSVPCLGPLGSLGGSQRSVPLCGLQGASRFPLRGEAGSDVLLGPRDVGGRDVGISDTRSQHHLHRNHRGMSSRGTDETRRVHPANSGVYPTRSIREPGDARVESDDEEPRGPR